VRPGDLSRLDAAFFTMNGVMSVVVFSFGLLDRLMKP
jgi:4-hydroxybenzoate polyprenyltransferase